MSELPEDVDERVDELYCVPLDRFVAERAALTKELRAEGRRAEATAVSRIAKPALAAWAVNQVVRSQPKAAHALWEAGDAVLGVQARAVSGEASGEDLRAAIAAQRAALAPLAEAARGMLTARGAFLNEQAVQAVIETLHAAAVDPEARPDVEAGRLARPLRLAGLGALPAGGAAKRPAPSGGATESPSAAGGAATSADAEEAPSDEAERRAAEEPERRAEEDAERLAEEERRAEEARLREREREKSLAAARRTLDRARRARDSGRERVERRRSELEAAEAELARLEEDVRAAEDALDE